MSPTSTDHATFRCVVQDVMTHERTEFTVEGVEPLDVPALAEDRRKALGLHSYFLFGYCKVTANLDRECV